MKTGQHEVIVFDARVRNVIGYARVSRQDQNLDGQRDALQKAGVGRAFCERVSSVGTRPGWAALLSSVRAGDVVVVTRLDRIGRKLSEVVASVQGLVEEGIHVRALMQGVDTSGPGGTIMLALWAALAETERETLRERTREGMAAAKKRGRSAGRPVVLDAAKRELVQHLHAKGYSIAEIAKAAKAGKTTVRRALSDAEKPEAKQLKLLGTAAAEQPAAAPAAEPEDSTVVATRRFANKAAACAKKHGGAHPFRTVAKGHRFCDGCGLEQYDPTGLPPTRTTTITEIEAKQAKKRDRKAKVK